MAAIESQETSSTPCSYHVFLSFRGKDTRKTFTDHLYTALRNAGINTFRDDDELGRGEDISSEVIKAIEESKISIIVFSKDYACSTRCLDELLKILERKKTVGHIILPVFYHVYPSDLRWLEGSFGEAFAKHEMRFKSELITRWKEALREVADLSGSVLTINEYEADEADFIQEIVEDTSNKLDRTTLSICQYPIGLNSRIKDIDLWLQDGSSKASIMAICGMGGIGKTTIAKTLYNLNFNKFEGSSFLANIRETSKEPNGLVHLQKQLLSTILKGKKVKISNVHEGSTRIKEVLSSKRVLLVLDDVDRLDQLKAVLAMRDWIKQGSKIIITSRDEQLLKAFKLNEIQKVEELGKDESLQLFSWHAFGQGCPIEAYTVHSKRVVEYCGGLPLALVVLGSSLYGEEVDVWECAIRKLEVSPNRDIIEKLKISFDSLEDDYSKNLFLDIACFFVGKKKDFVNTVLDACELHPKIGIDNLINRCLLTVDGYNKLRMHQLLQEMGREIIRQESPMYLGKRSRLWRDKDALNVLREKNGTKTIEGLILNLHGSNSSTESSSTSNEEDLQTDAFSKMRNLRLLQLNNVRLTGNYKQFPRKLRWLCWSGFYLEFIPIEFCLENLVVLEMKKSNLKLVWKGKKLFRSLKILNLSHSHSLTETPDFSNVPNLERLILKDCINLIEVHESTGELKRLVLLNLKDCKNLENLPMNIGQLKALEKFIISGCSKLVGPIKSSESISFSLPRSLVELSLKNYNLSNYAIPRDRISFSLPRSLVELSLENCNLSDDAIPRDLGRLSLLKKLNLNGNPICSLPQSIFKGLTMLKLLELDSCTSLQLLPELPMSSQYLDVRNCRSLEIITNLPNHLRLGWQIKGCKKVVEVKKLYRLEPIGNIDAEMIKNLELVELESMENNVEVTLFNNVTCEEMIGPIQGLYEYAYGIFSIFDPWNEVPHWFSNRSTEPQIHLKVPSRPNLKIRGLNVCVVYAYTPSNKTKDVYRIYRNLCQVSNFNKTKDVMWIYNPRFIGIPDKKENMRWSSHWKIENQLEAGDEVLVEVRSMFELEVKEFGVHIVYEEVEKDTPPQH